LLNIVVGDLTSINIIAALSAPATIAGYEMRQQHPQKNLINSNSRHQQKLLLLVSQQNFSITSTSNYCLYCCATSKLLMLSSLAKAISGNICWCC